MSRVSTIELPVLEMSMRLSETGLMQILFTLILAASALDAQPPRKPETVERSNLVNCLRGLSGCDISTLSPDELKQVAEASKKRNLDACLNGSSLCDPTRLTSIDARSVQTALYRRNLEKCITGSATCDPVRLKNTDAAGVEKASLS